MINVLDKGYVRFVDKMGSDLSVTNAARTSYDKESAEFSPADERLLNFLLREGHTSPLRHAAMTFEIYAPLMVARQHWKYAVASTFVDDQNGWNESCLPSWQELWSYGNERVTVQDLIDGKNPPLRSVSDSGQILPNRIKRVWKTGNERVYTISDEFGNRVSCTSSHRIMTPDGWVEAGSLRVGMKIAHNGAPAYTNKAWMSEMCKKHTAREIAEICGVTDRTIHEYKKEFGLSTSASNNKLYANQEWLREHYIDKNMTLVEVASLASCSTHNIRRWVKKFGLQKDSVAVLGAYIKKHGTFIPEKEQALERASKARETRYARYGKKSYRSGSSAQYRVTALDQEGWTHCFYCEAEIDEVHHRDHDRKNNSVSNLIGLCKGHHWLLHGKRPLVYGFGQIVDISDVGSHDVYDIEMELEDNFIAGGVVVHNSRRYITEDEQFYIPTKNEWRSKPENSKQGSGPLLVDDDRHGDAAFLTANLREHIDRSLALYDQALDLGVAPEQARLFLPAYGMYVRYRWTTSLAGVLHFLSQRLEHDSQKEIQEYARAVKEYVQLHFPNTWRAYESNIKSA